MKEEQKSLRSVLLGPVGASVLLVLICIGVWSGLVLASFSNDDELLITNNLFIRDLAHLWDNLTRDYFYNSQGSGIGYWRPLTKATYMVGWALWGENPAGYYAVNVALFSTMIVLAATVMRRAGATGAVALGAAALAAVHPAHAESIGIITARSDVLVATFLLALLAIELRPATRRMTLVWGLLAAAAALASKEVGVVAPILVGIAHMVGRGATWRVALRRAAPYFVLVAVYAATRLSLDITPIAGAHSTIDNETMVLATGKVVGLYTARLATPALVQPLTAYAVFPKGADAGTLMWCALGVLGVASLCGMLVRRKLWLAIAWIALPLAPALSLRYVTISVHADWLPAFDRSLLLSSLGVAWLMASAIEAVGSWLARRGYDRRWALSLGGLWAIVALLGALQNVADSRTVETRNRAFVKAIERMPVDQRAPFQQRFVLEERAIAQAQSGDLAGAEQSFAELSELDPSDPVVRANLAMIYRMTGRPKLAVKQLRWILRQTDNSRANRDRREIFLELARAESEAGNPEAAERAWQRAMKLEADE
ncbi:MAG: hypothetical protein ACI8QZ_002617 [Chlamydiales bacterium]|jgi:hypothetical protein